MVGVFGLVCHIQEDGCVTLSVYKLFGCVYIDYCIMAFYSEIEWNLGSLINNVVKKYVYVAILVQ